MNFDLNMLSNIMQALGKQSAAPNPSPQSPFIAQNGIGERIDLKGKPTNPMAGMMDMLSKGDNNMMSIFPMLMGMMGGKQSSPDRPSYEAPSSERQFSEERPAEQPYHNEKSYTDKSQYQNESSPNNDDRYAPNRNGDQYAHTINERGDGRFPNSSSQYDQEENNDTYNKNYDEEYVKRDRENLRTDSPDMPQKLRAKRRYLPICFAGYQMLSALNRLYSFALSKQQS